MNSRSRWLVATGIILVLILSACGNSGTSTTTTTANGTTTTITHLKIMVGGLSKQIYLPNELTQQLGYFKQEGLDVTLIDEASGQSSEDEVLAGQGDAGSGSYNHTIELQPKGKQMEAVGLLNIAPGEAEIVSAKTASQIHSVKDLKGKNLGVTELGSGTQTLTTALLHNAGITPDQVHFIPVGAGDTFIAALQQGKIDAGMTTEPTISRILSSGVGKVLVDLRSPQSTHAALGGPYPFISLFMNNRSDEHTSELQSPCNRVCRLLLEKKIDLSGRATASRKMPRPRSRSADGVKGHPCLSRYLTLVPQPVLSSRFWTRCRVL